MVEIRDSVNHILRDQLIHEPLAQPIDLHRSPARPVQQRLLQLCRACLRQAATDRLAFLAVNLAAADRTARRHFEWDAVGRALDNADDFRYDVAAALDQDAIVDGETEAPDFIFIVQRGVANGGAPKLNRLEHSHRRYRARAAD